MSEGNPLEAGSLNPWLLQHLPFIVRLRFCMSLVLHATETYFPNVLQYAVSSQVTVMLFQHSDVR